MCCRRNREKARAGIIIEQLIKAMKQKGGIQAAIKCEPSQQCKTIL